MGKIKATIKMAIKATSRVRGRNLLKAKKMLHEAKKQKLYSKLKVLYADAKKNIRDLQRHNLGDTPAIQKLEENGKIKFSVKGKTYNELQSDYFRLKRFAESETSTVKGATNVLENIARNTNIQYDDLNDLISKSRVFFDIASKVEQILEAQSQLAFTMGYQTIWTAVNNMVERKKINLRDIHNIEESAKIVYDSLINEYLQEEMEESILSEFFD
jgi:hypothetical protein